MKQLLQNVRTGELVLEEVPAPASQPAGIVVRNQFSLVSSGTERATINFARQGLIGKARSRPDLVKQVIKKVRTAGLPQAYAAVMHGLNTRIPLGYSSAGEVLEIGDQVTDIAVGDIVACAGAGYASHAEIVYVPQNLAVKLPNRVTARQGAFATLGAIALQGIRRAELSPGESVAVIGLGLIGQLTVQILRAYGFPVLGLDVDPRRVEQTSRWQVDRVGVIGRDNTEGLAQDLSAGFGVDAVIITAASQSAEPIQLAGKLLRQRGRVSIVGDVRMDVPRRLYYGKELDVRVSRSYGPGRYDPAYEEHGIDYPLPYVRWTERRNMDEFMRLVADSRVNVDSMVLHSFPLEQATAAYRLILENPNKEPFLGVLLEYPSRQTAPERTTRIYAPPANLQPKRVDVGVIGAGGFAQSVLLPALLKLKDVRVKAIATASGRNATTLARRYKSEYATTDYKDILSDRDVNLVLIATRHGLHAQLVTEAIKAGKDVFVEKPLAIDAEQLLCVLKALRVSPQRLMVGFNRRFSPMAREMKAFLQSTREPLLMHYRVNAGYIPPEHWIHDPVEGGGRIIGEVCHFVDFLSFLSSQSPTMITARALPDSNRYRRDNLVLTLTFPNGSLGTITYAANGERSFAKERVEVFGGGMVAVLDDFKRLELVRDGVKKISKTRLTQDKGHQGELEFLVKALMSREPSPLPLQEVIATTLTTFKALDALRTGEPVRIGVDAFIAESETQLENGDCAYSPVSG